MNDPKPPPSQAEKFKDAARKHQADENESRWKTRLRRIAKAKPKAEE